MFFSVIFRPEFHTISIKKCLTVDAFEFEVVARNGYKNEIGNSFNSIVSNSEV